jgi:hypothetical protein
MEGRPLRVVFDNNIWSYVGDEGSRPALEKLLDKYGLQLLHAPSVLLEVLRTPRPDVRRRIVQAMVLGRPGRKLRSEADVEADELIREIRRLRPEWLRSAPDVRKAEGFRRFWTRGIWQAVETDLEAFIERAALLPLPEQDAEIEEIQAARIAALKESDLDWTALDSYAEPAPEAPAWYREGWPEGKRVQEWRVATRDVAWEALARAPLRRLVRYEDTTYADFIGAEVNLSALRADRANFTSLMFDEVELDRMRRWWLRWATDAAQAIIGGKTGGNPRDVQHASYLLDCDLFVTADRRYQRALSLVEKAAPFAMAQVLLVRRAREEPVVPAIARALDELA